MTFIFIMGLLLMIFGFFGGHEILGEYWPFLNELTKDQVVCAIGATWVIFASEALGQRRGK